MGALDFSFSQGRTTQLLPSQQLPNSAILPVEQLNPFAFVFAIIPLATLGKQVLCRCLYQYHNGKQQQM
ncbi:MAG: hypothetical protein EOO38_18210 [Cytophagaceae bacterium]|nr:MAG: hypothetical protein EOO38_18210 [Cytophagaceae bacterium]